MDGMQVLRQVKTDPDLKSIPMVVLTSSLEERDLVEIHGERYAEYRRSVPMLVPRVRATQLAATKVARTETA